MSTPTTILGFMPVISVLATLAGVAGTIYFNSTIKQKEFDRQDITRKQDKIYSNGSKLIESIQSTNDYYIDNMLAIKYLLERSTGLCQAILVNLVLPNTYSLHKEIAIKLVDEIDKYVESNKTSIFNNTIKKKVEIDLLYQLTWFSFDISKYVKFMSKTVKYTYPEAYSALCYCRGQLHSFILMADTETFDTVYIQDGLEGSGIEAKQSIENIDERIERLRVITDEVITSVRNEYDAIGKA